MLNGDFVCIVYIVCVFVRAHNLMQNFATFAVKKMMIFCYSMFK